MTPFDFEQPLDRAQRDLTTAKNDVAAVTLAIARGDQGLDEVLSAATARVAAAQARIDAAIAGLPAPRAPVDDPLPPPSPAAAVPVQSDWDRLMAEQDATTARQFEITDALSEPERPTR
jgi:hypothetical protein